MTLSYYEPWNLLNQMNRALRTPNYPTFSDAAENADSEAPGSEWTPAVDIKEEQDRFIIRADIPGVKRDDIDITMENGILALKGQRAHETDQERTEYRRNERAHGSFNRRFSLPDTADAERISAKSSDGVLEVVIPKHEKLQPRKIQVQ